MQSRERDYIIIGAGPAGLQLGYFFEKSGQDYLILEAGETAGTSFKQYPRHRKLISINKVYTGFDDTEINLRWDWNSLLNDSDDLLFKHYSRDYFPNADALYQYLQDFAAHYALQVKYGVQVVRVAKNSERFLVIDGEGQVYAAKRLIVATGFSRPYLPPIPGIELAENYVNMSIDPEEFANQRVLIVGKGNSGFETADNLIATTALLHVCSPRPISLAWQTKYVGHLRAVNNNFLDTYQLKSQNAILDASIRQIARQGDKFVVSVAYTHADGETEDLVYDRVLLCTGFQFDTSIFDPSCQPNLAYNDKFPEQTSQWESTNVKDLYFAGVLMHMRDYKHKQSGFIHGFRYNVQALQQILDEKYHSQPIPYQAVAPTAASLLEVIVQRVNTSSALWQQTGFLCDTIVLPQDSQTAARYYPQLPTEYIHDSKLAHGQYFTVSLEFGSKQADPFSIQRHPDPHQADDSAFLHPVIRHFSAGKLLAEQHLLEDLDADWTKDVHVQPLQAFLSQQLTTALTPVPVPIPLEV